MNFKIFNYKKKDKKKTKKKQKRGNFLALIHLPQNGPLSFGPLLSGPFSFGPLLFGPFSFGPLLFGPLKEKPSNPNCGAI